MLSEYHTQKNHYMMISFGHLWSAKSRLTCWRLSQINSPQIQNLSDTHGGSWAMEPETSDPQTKSRKITLHFQISWLWTGRWCNSYGSLRKIFSPTIYLSCDIHLLSWCLWFQKLRLTPPLTILMFGSVMVPKPLSLWTMDCWKPDFRSSSMLKA